MNLYKGTSPDPARRYKVAPNDLIFSFSFFSVSFYHPTSQQAISIHPHHPSFTHSVHYNRQDSQPSPHGITSQPHDIPHPPKPEPQNRAILHSLFRASPPQPHSHPHQIHRITHPLSYSPLSSPVLDIKSKSLISQPEHVSVKFVVESITEVGFDRNGVGEMIV